MLPGGVARAGLRLNGAIALSSGKRPSVQRESTGMRMADGLCWRDSLLLKVLGWVKKPMTNAPTVSGVGSGEAGRELLLWRVGVCVGEVCIR